MRQGRTRCEKTRCCEFGSHFGGLLNMHDGGCRVQRGNSLPPSVPGPWKRDMGEVKCGLAVSLGLSLWLSLWLKFDVALTSWVAHVKYP